MQIRGSTIFSVSVTTVWQFFATPSQVSQCLPHLADWQTVQPDTTYQLLIHWPFTPYNNLAIPVWLEWQQQTPPHSLTAALVAQLQQQTIPATADLQLHPLSPTQTQVDFQFQIHSPSLFAQQLIRQNAPKMIDAFFKTAQQKCATHPQD